MDQEITTPERLRNSDLTSLDLHSRRHLLMKALETESV